MKLVIGILVLSLALVFESKAIGAETELVQNIGGVFIYAEDNAKLAKWYEQNLGITMTRNEEENTYMHLFFHGDLKDPKKQNFTVFSIHNSTDKVIAKNQFVMNLQVSDLKALLERLRANGVKIEKEQDYPYGRFAWFQDGEGNKLEVWEPTAPPKK